VKALAAALAGAGLLAADAGVRLSLKRFEQALRQR
jgi:hypothetical protein